MPKQRYIVFHEYGGEIIKGEEPKEGSYIKAPPTLPTYIPMHYWKLQDGIICEMNPEEKQISDAACAEKPVPQERPEIQIAPSMKQIESIEQEVIHVDEIVEEFKNNITNAISPILDEHAGQLKYLKTNHDKDIEHLEYRISKVSEKLKAEIQQAESRNNNMMHHIKDADESRDGIIKLMGTLEDSHTEKYQEIDNKFNEQSNEINDAILNAELIQSEHHDRLEKLEKYPKVEKFYIINNFHIKEYAQIIVTSTVISLIIRALFH